MENLLPYLGGIFIALGTIIGVYYSVALGNKVDIKQKEIKQLNEDIKSLGKSNQSLISQNLKLSETIKDLNTGGSGFINFRNANISMYEKGVQSDGYILDLFITLYNNGDYAFDDIKIKGFKLSDYLSADPNFSTNRFNVFWFKYSQSIFKIKQSSFKLGMSKLTSDSYLPELDFEESVFKSGQSITLGPISFKEDFDYFGINFFIETKRQDFIVLIRFKRPDDKSEPFVSQVSTVYKVNGVNGIEELDLNYDPSFPKFDDNNLKWFKTKIPKQWFKENQH